jgi:hypothetical protein
MTGPKPVKITYGGYEDADFEDSVRGEPYGLHGEAEIQRREAIRKADREAKKDLKRRQAANRARASHPRGPRR